MTGPRRLGERMAVDIAEQPHVWRQVLGDAVEQITAAARRVTERSPRFVLFVARGTSDQAALYAKYLVEIVLQLPAGMVSPSTMTAYGARPDLHDVLMIAVSQSGSSPDLVQSIQLARTHGAFTLAVTNNPSSELAAAAELHVDILAGEERAMPATKSYTAQLLVLHQLVARIAGRDGSAAAALPDLAEQLLRENRVAELADRYRFASRMVTTGRGYSYPTAREAALKLMETSYIGAQAFSGADLLHGPLAMIDRLVPVLAIVSDGAGGAAMRQVLARLADVGADTCVIGPESAAGDAATRIVIPGVPEELSPLLEILPVQQLALHLAVARGVDPDRPRGLQKVTRTL
jgi:glucosamine--fructose-6-phosphate aminotransferase (isomerizing)